jgi:mycoredoxin
MVCVSNTQAQKQEDVGHLRVYTTTRCGDCTMAKAVLDKAGLAYEEIDIDHDPAAAETVLAINGGYRTVPTILLADGRVLVEPSRQALLSALGVGEGA